jgi:hypothetical protein
MHFAFKLSKPDAVEEDIFGSFVPESPGGNL